jgi:hypothetical protein
VSAVSIKGLDKAAVLAALHNGTRSLGVGSLRDLGRDMTVAEARGMIESRGGGLYFDYVAGRAIKVDLSGDEFDPGLYDRDAGDGQAELVIAPLRGGR